jgi:hypothetical protein
MLKKNVLRLTAISTMMCSVSAFSYQYEVGGDLGRADGQGDDDTIFSMHGTVYMENVADQDGPRKVYPFLAKSSYADFEYSDDGDDDDMTVSGRYVFDQVKGYFIDGSLVAGDTDILTVLGGLYLTDTSTIEGGLIRYESGNDDEFLINAAYENLLSLGTNGNVLGNASLTLGDVRIIDLSAMYFLNYDLGLGLGFSDIYVDDNPGQDSQNITLQVSYFLQPNIELYGSYENSDYDNGDVDTFLFGANVRL